MKKLFKKLQQIKIFQGRFIPVLISEGTGGISTVETRLDDQGFSLRFIYDNYDMFQVLLEENEQSDITFFDNEMVFKTDKKTIDNIECYRLVRKTIPKSLLSFLDSDDQMSIKYKHELNQNEMIIERLKHEKIRGENENRN